MPEQKTIDKIMFFLKDIETRKIKIIPQRNPQVYTCGGDVRYKCSNGWEITIFNDAGKFDYIDHIYMSSGLKRNYDFETLWKMEAFQDYQPPIGVLHNVYGIDIYGCDFCGDNYNVDANEDNECVVLCEDCRKKPACNISWSEFIEKGLWDV